LLSTVSNVLELSRELSLAAVTWMSAHFIQIYDNDDEDDVSK